MKKTFKNILLTFVAVVFVMAVFAFSSSAADSGKWISAWGTGSTNVGIEGFDNIYAFVGQVTARTVITPTASGTKMRIKLSNHFGKEPIKIETCTVAKSIKGSSIDTASVRFVTFKGSPSVEIPAGAEIFSDEIYFPVTALQDIAISTYLKDFSDIRTMGLSGGETYLSLGETDDTRAGAFGLASEIDASILDLFEKSGLSLDRSLSYSIIHVVPLISSIDVFSTNTDAFSVAVVGDSTVSNNYPLFLAEEISKEDHYDVGVVGRGIIGNSLGSDGLGYGSFIFGESLLKRFERDVLHLSGVKYVIVKIGVNDIVHPVCNDIKEQYPGIKQPTANQIIENFRSLFRTCHKNGMKVIAVGITQWKGYTRNFLDTGDRYIRTEEELQRDFQIAADVNRWLASTNEHDGYVDYYDISKNPDDPQAYLPEYTLDGAHPTDTLLKLWAQNFPFSLMGIGTKVGYVTLDKSTLDLKYGESSTLKATIFPAHALNKNVSWSSSNPSVATVDRNGVVRAVGTGSCEIVVETQEAGKTARCVVNVIVPVSGVSINQQTASVYTTKTTNLSATVLPSTATNKTLTWTSANEKVATVDSKGTVRGVGAGTTTITCKTNDGGFTSSCLVTVVKKVEVESLSLNASSKALYIGSTYQLSANIFPLTATFQELTWKSDNVKVATVDSNGLVIAVGVGTANITCASADNPFVVKKCTIKSSIQVTGVTINPSSVSLYETATKMLAPVIVPSNATNKGVVWSSSDTSIATVNNDGVVTAVSKGTAIIRCTTKDSQKVATCTVTVLRTIMSKSVKLDAKELTIYDGRSKTLVATIKPSNVSIKTAKWSSSNKKVATVSSNGKVTGIAPGKCVITCKTKDTGKVAKCTIIVKPTKVKKVALNKTAVNIVLNKTYQLKAVTTPTYATNQNVTWKSSNKNIAKVSKSGKVTAVSFGTATITCTTVDGKKVARCTVKVIRPKMTSIKVAQSELEVGLNGNYTINAKPVPSTANASKMRYESSDPSIARVNSKGVITGVSEGTVIITITPNDGGKGKGTLVVVKVIDKPVIGIKLDKTYYNTNVGKTFKLKATVLPTDASNRSISWSSTNTRVATVDSKGNVKAVGKGNCYIRVISNDNGAVSVCHVYVS